MNKSFVISMFLFLFCPGLKAQTQAELNLSAASDYHYADSLMQRTIKEVQEINSEDGAFQKLIARSQKSWEHYRDDQVDLKFPFSSASGSINPFCRLNYLAELTSLRTAELRQWITGTSEGDVCGGTLWHPAK